MAKKAGTSLGLSIFLIIGFLVVLTAGSALVATVIGSRLARDAVLSDLRRINSGQAVLLQQRFRELELIARVVAEESWVAQHLTGAASRTDDATEMRTLVEDLRAERSLDLVIFLSPEGKVIFRSGTPEKPAMDTDFNADSLFSNLHGDPQKTSASALWAFDEGLYPAAMVKLLTRKFDIIGYLGIATTIAPMADELERTTGADVLLFAQSPTGPAVVASTYPSPDEVIAALRLGGQLLPRIQRGEVIPGADLKLGGELWLSFLTPLRDAADQPVGAAVGLTALGSRLEIYRQMQLLLVGVASAALVIGLLLSLLMGRRVLAPVNQLATAAQEIQNGNYEPGLPPARGHFGPLVAPLELLARKLRDKETLAAYLDQRRRELPEPARLSAAESQGTPAAQQLALVGVEMRRFANPKIGYDPEENVARFARDLQRISATVVSRQGTVEAIQGHRVLAIFAGEDQASRALAAATEILLTLTHRENAFDEPVPPVVGVTHGSVVTGTMRRGSETQTTIVGLPVQQLESLLREATPGEIFMAKPAAETLYPAMQAAGIELGAQRGLVSPMSLYKLTAEAATRFTGVRPPQDHGRTGAQSLALTDVIAGETLGGRFEILAEFGNGPSGASFKCRDNERADFVRLKILKPEVLAEETRLERIKESLELVRMIGHANVLGVYDFGQVDGLAYISADFVQGTPLRFFCQKGRALPLTPAFLLARSLAEGLVVAHRQKLVHGVLKPENVLVEPTGRTKIMDFGLGKIIGAAERESSHPAAVYLAPEQIDGGPATFASDVYAWGVMFYELVTGHPPTTGATPAEVGRKRAGEAPEPPSLHCDGLPPTLDTIVLRSLEADPAARHSTAEELVRELDALRA